MLHPSPNFDDRPEGTQVDILVLHYTDTTSTEEARTILIDPAAKVSAHYLIDDHGVIEQLVPENKRAWHAGVSSWRGNENINDRSIGIELVNPGHRNGLKPFPAVQMLSLIELCRDILDRHPIPQRNIVGHSDIAPTRKKDPGELFDWRMLAREYIGLWPEVPDKLPDITELDVGMMDKEVERLQQRLVEFGYLLKTDGYYGNNTQATVTAFQRHFTQRQVNGAWGPLQEASLEALLKLL